MRETWGGGGLVLVGGCLGGWGGGGRFCGDGLGYLVLGLDVELDLFAG